jgi:RHS repeat-associated protein
VVIDPIRDVAIWEWSSKSEVFGNQVPNVDADGDGVGFELALRFPGQQATDASGMFYNYQRDYDPAVGRYSQSDPIGLHGGLATYLYVLGAPVGGSDPFGLRGAGILSGSEAGGIPGVNGINPFGHIAIATASGVYSFGTAHPYGSSTAEYIQSQVANRNVEVVTFDTTPQQEAMIEQIMKSHGKANYDLKSRNCATAVADSLLSTNMIDDRSPLPGRMFQEMMLIKGAQYYFIPKGGAIPEALLNSVSR